MTGGSHTSYTGDVNVSQPPGGIEDLRCADSDRQLVAEVLGTAYAEGRITLEEHDERTGLAYRAKTFRELNALTTDLIPGSTAPARLGESPHRQVAPLTDFHEGRAILSTYQPAPPLRMPAASAVTTILGEARLDLVEAQFDTRVVHLNIHNVLGEVRIRVPEGVHVADRTSNIMGEIKVTGTTSDANSVTLVLEGTVLLGTVRVMGPDTRPRKYRRFIR